MAEYSRLAGESMGTSWSVLLDDPAHRDLHAVHAAVEEVLELVVAQMSTWEPSSEISRFNAAEAGSWHEISKEFFAVLECGLGIAKCTGGAFDPAVGRLVSLWGFGAHALPSLSRTEIDDALLASNYLKLRLDASSMSVFQPGGLSLDLSAIAKGFSADVVAMQLQEIGITSALVEVGGELFAFGASPRGGDWNVLVETGADEEEALADPRVVKLNGQAVATSGDQWFRHERDDRIVSHSIDPRNGEPISNRIAAVTVIHGSAMQADAWATALSIMGEVDGVAYADAQDIAARFVIRTDDGAVEKFSPSFQRYLVQ